MKLKPFLHVHYATTAWLAVVFAAWITPSPSAAAGASAIPPEAAPQSLLLESGQSSATRLRGRDARQQLIVTGRLPDGKLIDLSTKAEYRAEPAGIVRIDSTGLVQPLADGQATVRVRFGKLAAELALIVSDCQHEPAINFPNQIVPIFTKYGCNSGGCHGKASGQNGFRLSLLGFEPAEDHEHLLKEGRGRRLFPSVPERSLLLEKATNSVPHGGGHRLDVDSHEYRLLVRWVGQGMPYGKSSDPSLVRLSIYPESRSMSRHGAQQLIALAHYSDGGIEDVTRLAQYEPNSTEMAEASAAGLVRTLDLAGDVAVMARYQGQVAVFRATLPLGVNVTQLPKTRGPIDEVVFKKLKTLGVPPSAISDDAAFVRRVTVDIAGRLPTVDETRQFLSNKSGSKRDELIDRLLASGDYADYFANKWSALLRNKRRAPDYARGTYAFHSWIRESFYTNKPYDQFVREIVTASGDIGENPPVAWYREVKDVDQQVEDCAQLFLGLRIQCARCHHHPFEKWSQQDYYGFAAFFSQVGRKNGDSQNEPRVFHRRGLAGSTNPKSGERLLPTGLGSKPIDIAAERDPRAELSDWMADPANPFFARALVNRYWKHFFGRGIVDPEDDMRVTNPASNPELLDFLARHFVESGFDLKELVRTICRSTTYQLSAEPNEHNASDKQNFSRYYPRRLNAEVLLDALDMVTRSPTSFAGLPAGMRAVQLPDTTVNSYFLTVFGRPESASACECERSQEANLAQSLHLLNSAEIQGKLTNPNGRAAALARDSARPAAEHIRELYLSVFSREPLEQEMSVAVAHLNRNQNKQQAYEDIVWALVNTKEFLFNH